jgi:hypothetical protein
MDAVQETSTLPAVTVVVRDGTVPFGFNPGDPNNPASIRIIGDRTAYDQLLTAPVNDLAHPGGTVDWRRLIDLEGDHDLFPALPDASNPKRRPPILIVPRSQTGDRLILVQPPTAP